MEYSSQMSEAHKRQHRKKWSSCFGYRLWAIFGLLLVWVTPAAGTPYQARIVNGLNTSDFPATGALLVGNDAGSATSWCSGTLIGCNTFLTAAHCVEGNSNPAGYFVYFQHAGTFSVTSMATHPSYFFPEADVAVLSLGETVTGIEPIPLNDIDPNNHIGTSGLIAGFGRSGGNRYDYGVKRWGTVQTVDCNDIGENRNQLVCWQYANPIGAPGNDSNTCNGDSGGPLFMDLGAGTTIGGITSGGNNSSCLAVDASYDVNVYNYRTFIRQHLGTDPITNCSALPAVGASTVAVTGFEGELDGGNTSANHVLTTTTPADQLRISLNSADDGFFNADLYVRQGVAATTGNNDCARDGSGPHGTCFFENAPADQWHILVKRTSGSGEYQVTATEFADTNAVCGNGIREWGEDCDGADADSCSGLCQVDCTCPAPVCGNNVVEAGETCDGASDDACPGECSSGCGCASDPCTGSGTTSKVRLTLGRLDRPDGDQSLTFTGDLEFPSGTLISLDPIATGAQVIIQDVGNNNARILDLSAQTTPIPPGATGTGCHPKDGWTVNKQGTAFTYRNKTGDFDGSPCMSGKPERLTVKFIDKRSKTGKIRFSVKAMKSALGPNLVGPFRGTIALGELASDLQTTCGDHEFAPGVCTDNIKGTTKKCR